MKDEFDPVTPDELVLRLVWKYHYDINSPDPVKPKAFAPKGDETDGISVFRGACLSRPEQALEAMAPNKRDGSAIAALPVAEVVALGLTVRPARIDAIPGH